MNAHKYGNFSVILRQMLEFAVDSEIIEKNLFLDVRINRRRVLVPEVKKPDHTQVFTKSEEVMLINKENAFCNCANRVSEIVSFTIWSPYLS